MNSADPHGRWRTYWNARSDTGHRYEEDWWVRLKARELAVFFPEGKLRVLECGCGTGDMYPEFLQHVASYNGVDLSQTMIGKFKTAHPEATLQVGSATDLSSFASESFDLVVSSGMIQYLEPSQLLQHLNETRRVLKPKGTFIIGHIADRALSWQFYGGALRSDQRFSIRNALRGQAGRYLKRGGEFGRWYGRREVARICKQAELEGRTFSSSCYEYRFHVVGTKA